MQDIGHVGIKLGSVSASEATCIAPENAVADFRRLCVVCQPACSQLRFISIEDTIANRRIRITNDHSPTIIPTRSIAAEHRILARDVAINFLDSASIAVNSVCLIGKELAVAYCCCSRGPETESSSRAARGFIPDERTMIESLISAGKQTEHSCP